MNTRRGKRTRRRKDSIGEMVKDEKIGILGGTFDPVHVGHLMVAQDAMDALGLRRVVFVPAALPPHKTDRDVVSAEERFEMVRLAVAESKFFSVSDVEYRRSGPSFSIDTISGLRERYSRGELYFLIGEDNLRDIWSWKEPDKLFNTCSVVVIGRAGREDESGFDNLPGPAIRLDIHRIDLSSSEIRSRIGEGRSISYLVPPAVERYIYGNHLYARRK